MTFAYRGTIAILNLIMFVCGALSFGLPSDFMGPDHYIPQRSVLPFRPTIRLDQDGQSTCDSGAEAGVCYDALNCLQVSGIFGNNCPQNKGVCCLFKRQCGQQTSQEVSYFQNSEEEAGPSCSYRVVKRSSNYCGMRVSLESLKLPTDCQASLSIEGVHKGQNIGRLRFTERNDADKICSTETGKEYQFETRDLDEVLVNVNASGGITGKWKIRVTQVQCKDFDSAIPHDSHIPAIWPPPLPAPITHAPTSTTAKTPSTATCWWNCPTGGVTNTPKPGRPVTTVRPDDTRYSKCGVRGPDARSEPLNTRTNNVNQAFIENLEYANPNKSESIFAEEIGNRKNQPIWFPGSGKITYGKPSGKREYPWQVGMKVRGRFHCGASLIGDQYVLTAAHCVTKYKNSPRTLYLTLGDWDLNDANEQVNVVPIVKSVTVHPQYSRTTLRNDIAVLKLTKKVKFADNIRPICLAPAGFDTTDKIAIVTGWGRNEANRLMTKLHELASAVVSNTYCARQWEINGAPGGFITKDMMCMSPIGGDSCNGDSGGPSVTEINGIHYQVGLVSFGSGSCVDTTLPGVYTRITSYRDWIMRQMN